MTTLMLSRVADSLYWMSRYLERAENTARQANVTLLQSLDAAEGIGAPLRLERLLHSLDLQDTLKNVKSLEEEILLKRLTFDAAFPSSVNGCLTTARENARQVREQISSEMWMQINRLYLYVHQANPAAVWNDLPHNFYVNVKEGSHLFQGITDATMNHNAGWHFIQIGRYTERLILLASLLDAHLHLDAATQPRSYFEMVATLKSVSAFEAYCKVYTSSMQPENIAEFLLFNPEFPRSARFCTQMILNSLEVLAENLPRGKAQRLNRFAGRLESMLSYDDIQDVRSAQSSVYLHNLRDQAFHIHEALFDTYVTYSIESALA
ncbi:MAG: alpha-E domain-containing protein [Phototrophicaceae bacterium]|jgi:uncharacterized alpha-E superfamily protein